MPNRLYFYTFYVLLFCFPTFIDAAVYIQSPQQASAYPDPLVSDSKCQMDEPSFLCDPDQVFTKSERTQVHKRLQQLSTETKRPDRKDVCQSKGISLGVAISQRPMVPPAPYLPNRLAEYLHTRWALDTDAGTNALLADEMTHIIMSESVSLISGQTLDAFLGIINSVQALANHRTHIMFASAPSTGSKTSLVIVLLLLISIASGGLLYWLRDHHTGIKFTQMTMSDREGRGIEVDPNAVEYNRAGDRRW
uniref:Uncharacterized protein n=1 Tax=Ditylenchus dipsaci TaxID=166011 RepID=A0A915EPZ8_9BILA